MPLRRRFNDTLTYENRQNGLAQGYENTILSGTRTQIEIKLPSWHEERDDVAQRGVGVL